MREAPDTPRDVRIDKHCRDVISLLEENSGETIEVYASSVRDGEYAMRTDSLEKLVLLVADNSITIVDIEARNPEEGDGSRMVRALVGTAKEFGYQLRAQNVRPEFDSWWRKRGFAPPDGNEHSADYEYFGGARG